MNRTLKNTIAVLLVTAFTVLAIVGTVQASTAVTGVRATTVSGRGTYAQGATGSTGSGTLTCPRTGCTASYCHAAR